MSPCENGRDSAKWALATYTRPKCDWGTFETSRNAIFTARCPVSADFLTKKHRTILYRCGAEVKTYTRSRSLVSVHRSRRSAGKGQVYTISTIFDGEGREGADHVTLRFVIICTKTLCVKDRMPITPETKEAMRE